MQDYNTQFEESLDDLILEKLNHCHSFEEWNNEILHHFKNWTNQNNDVFEKIFIQCCLTAIAQGINDMPNRNNFYRNQFLNWFPKN